MSESHYLAALARYRKAGAKYAFDADLMAAFCGHDLQMLVGAVSPSLVWQGAVARKMTYSELAELVVTNPLAVSDLQWETGK